MRLQNLMLLRSASAIMFWDLSTLLTTHRREWEEKNCQLTLCARITASHKNCEAEQLDNGSSVCMQCFASPGELAAQRHQSRPTEATGRKNRNANSTQQNETEKSKLALKA
jgi:hypothetical protein